MADTSGSIGPPSARRAEEPVATPPPAPAPGPTPERPRTAVWPIVAVVVAAAGLALAVVYQSGRWSEKVTSPVERDQAQVAELVKTYLGARARRDGSKACSQLSDGQQREIVARVADLRMIDAQPSRCPALVANVSPQSRFTSPELGAYEGHEIDVRVSQNGVAAARPAGLHGPVLYAWKREDGWELDGSGMLWANFMRGCRAQVESDSYCGCVYDEVRARNPGRPAVQNDTMVRLWERMLRGQEDQLRRSIVDECGATEVRAGQGAGRALR